MSSNTGIVMQLNKNHACVMTSSGEFLKLKISKTPPKVGEVYTGQIVKDIPFYKYAITAATLTFIVLCSSTAYAYYTPVASVVVDINPSIKLDLNRWNRIIKATPLNEDGKKVLSELKVQNKSLNDGLNTLVLQAKKDNFINGDKSNNANTVNIDIDSSRSINDFNISQFEEKAKSDNIKLNITTSSINKTNDKSQNSDQKKPKFKETENNQNGNGNNKDRDTNKQNNNNNNNNNGNSNKNKNKNINSKEVSNSNSSNKNNQNDNKHNGNNNDQN
ncbi:anti-sigma factor domain-containing protein [Candidatus Clostridium radicumherbarum]|uniref:Anti-sigma factor domain-containing protein n=1 Tax=Candidatus Clostridium radicumherbarum TaxID=3381662 RepID=A0ABW8TRP2_9CLOT